MAKSPYSNSVRIPQPMIELCSKNVLVMDYLSGKKLAVAIEEELASILGGDIGMARKVLKAKQQTLFESKDVSGKCKQRFMQQLSDILGELNEDMTNAQKGVNALRLVTMTRNARKKLALLLDATGYQIFHDGVYNGDPHPGNILVLDDGRLGLIDYGQTRRLTKHDRLALAGVVAALGKPMRNVHEIANAMREFGFQSRYNNDANMADFAA